MKTITGIDLLEAFKRLDEELPAGAYKAVEGGKGGRMGLTDIKPGYLPPLLLELFGPCGLGWGFDLVSMACEKYRVKRNSGREEDEFCGRCEIKVWYRVTTNENETIKCDGIPVTGSSTNTQMDWAEKGALTYALGTAWFLAGYQVAVYKGERSHKDFANGNRQPQYRQQPAPQQRSNCANDQEKTGKAIKAKLGNAQYPAQVDEILATYKTAIAGMPQNWRDKLNNIADAKREALGGVAVNQ